MRRNLVGAASGNVADNDIRLCRGPDVDVVRADAIADDDFAAPESLNHRGGNSDSPEEDSIRVFARAKRLVKGQVLGDD
jgi:hypothetical protein